ncbi:MAG TPA: A/G-specific adenine glycosylase [Clostridia bacterium]|nr:A/G-specific adenine glycosylase [Clostridia bacterium]
MRKTRTQPSGTEHAALRLDARLSGLLIAWYDENARDLPWRRDRDPYRVWISEIMLQQTRAEVVKDYYVRFLAALPTARALADADEQTLMKLWEGLGYYGRARNLQKAARAIVNDLGGLFPETYEGLRALPGVGPYTAGALASICFELPTPAVDGNVLRVVSRIAGIGEPINAPEVKERVTKTLAALYPAARRGDFTQSIMELGATVCLPNGAPRCCVCPAEGICYARTHGAAVDFPVKSQKKERRAERRTVLLLACGEKTAIRKREREGLLGGLWELPNTPGELDAQGALDLAATWGAKPVAVTKSFRRMHIFTHVAWEMTCFSIECAEESPLFVWTSNAELESVYALPSAFRKLLGRETT